MSRRLISRRIAVWLVVGLGLGLGSAPNAAAQQRRGDAAHGERRGQAADSRDRREQIKRKIRALRAYTLTDELALDDATAAKLFPLLARYDDDFDRLLEQRVDVRRRLRHVDALRDPRAVERLIDDATANQRGFWDLQDKRLQALRKILTPVQTAKLLVVLPDIERRIERQLRSAIQPRRPGNAGADSAIEDDDQEPDEQSPPPQKLRRREAPLPPRGFRSNAPGNTPPCDPAAGPCR